jgi:hypothetical protein
MKKLFAKILEYFSSKKKDDLTSLKESLVKLRKSKIVLDKYPDSDDNVINGIVKIKKDLNEMIIFIEKLIFKVEENKAGSFYRVKTIIANEYGEDSYATPYHLVP